VEGGSVEVMEAGGEVSSWNLDLERNDQHQFLPRKNNSREAFERWSRVKVCWWSHLVNWQPSGGAQLDFTGNGTITFCFHEYGGLRRSLEMIPNWQWSDIDLGCAYMELWSFALPFYKSSATEYGPQIGSFSAFQCSTLLSNNAQGLNSRGE
jgi:hypothetical protein